MHIEYIKLKNFGNVRDEKIMLENGLIVVRGRNGSGKSTKFIEAPVYCLFGTNTLGAPLDDTVKQGEKVSSMRVEIKYGPYIVKRSKASASVMGPDVKISGQEEVSNFFYDLFGIMKGTAKYVLVSDQGEAAGILRKKPSEVTGLIESLAGFYQIDELIEKVIENFPHGMKAIYEDQIQETLVEQEEVNSTVEPAIKEMEHDYVKINIKMETAEGRTGTLKKFAEKLTGDLEILKEMNHKVEIFESELAGKHKRLGEINTKLTSIQSNAHMVFGEKEIKDAENLLENVIQLRERWMAYKWVTALEEGDEWEGNLSSFTTELTAAEEDFKKCNTSILKIKQEIVFKKNSIVTDETCKACGQDVKHLHEEINRKLEGEIEALEFSLQILLASMPEKDEYHQTLENIQNLHRNNIAESRPHLVYIDATKDTIPFRYSLKGAKPVEPNELAVKEASELLKSYSSVMAQIESDNKQCSDLTDEMDILKGEVLTMKKSEESKYVVVKTDDLDAKIEETEGKITLEENVIAILKEERGAIKTDIALARQEIKNTETKKKELKLKLEALAAKLKTDGRNSKLIKNVRIAKPIVLNTIWNKILHVVSKAFSEMMGRDVVVEKTAKGFRIDGLPVARLSGSEKSILGIALRSALRDIFAPSCGVIFFDEIFADCDVERTARGLAAIQLIPGQRIIVTHEDLSEQSADQLIEVT